MLSTAKGGLMFCLRFIFIVKHFSDSARTTGAILTKFVGLVELQLWL